jgi:uncharacterized membrane protein
MFSAFSFPKIDHARIVAAVRNAERGTSGEIRVAIARHRTRDPLASARRHFERLGMTQTAHRNGVLIFVAPASRNFAIIGDEGVHEKCGDGFWRALADAMTEKFRGGQFEEAVLHGVERAGALLAEHFPSDGENKNELSDDVADV